MKLFKVNVVLALLTALASSKAYSERMLFPARFAECPINFVEHLKTLRGIAQKISKDALTIKERNGVIRQVILENNSEFYEAQRTTLDKIEVGMYVAIIRTKNKNTSHSAVFLEASAIAASQDEKLLRKPMKVTYWHYHQADNSSKNVILSIKDEKGMAEEIIVKADTRIFMNNKITREMLRNGNRLFIEGYQDDDNYCKKHGKVNAQRIFIDNDEIIPIPKSSLVSPTNI